MFRSYYSVFKVRLWVSFSGPSKSNNIYLNFNLSPVPMTDHLRCFSSGGSLDVPILNFSTTYSGMNLSEFPHSEISGSMLICSSPKLIAAYHVFHRLPVPRHSPCALVRLTIQTILSREWLVFPLDSFLPTKIIVTLPFEIVIFLKKELTIIFVSQLLFSFQGTSWWCPSKPGLPELWFPSHGGPKWTRTIDLTIISRVL